jgi:hypothetical protein
VGTARQTDIAINLNGADAKQLETITRANIGHRLLLCLGDKPLIAPRIVEPLEHGFSVNFGDRTTNILPILESLVPRK